MKSTTVFRRLGERILSPKRVVNNDTTKHSIYSTNDSGATPSEFNASPFPKFREDEMAMLTSNPATIPMLKTILKCPLDSKDWVQVSDKDDQVLKNVTSMYDSTKLPSVTRILQATQPPLNQIILARWKSKMIAKLGEEGFFHYMTQISGEGSSFHESVENFLNKIPVDIEDTGQWKSIHPVLKKLQGVHGTEFIATHSVLSYLGKIDCVALYKNKLCVFDWKLSSKKRDSLKKCFDDPYQVAAYAGAFNACHDTPNKISTAVIVKAYRDGSPADVHFLDEMVLEFYWEGWVRRLARYHVQVFNSQANDDSSNIHKWQD